MVLQPSIFFFKKFGRSVQNSNSDNSPSTLIAVKYWAVPFHSEV